MELQTPSDNFIMSARKAETLVRLMWTRPPSVFLMVKKPNQPEITDAMMQMARFLQVTARAGKRAAVNALGRL